MSEPEFHLDRAAGSALGLASRWFFMAALLRLGWEAGGWLWRRW